MAADWQPIAPGSMPDRDQTIEIMQPSDTAPRVTTGGIFHTYVAIYGYPPDHDGMPAFRWRPLVDNNHRDP